MNKLEPIQPPHSAVAHFLEQKIAASDITQRELAYALGYTNPNIITMFKQGATKIPLKVAPKIAQMLNIDPTMFIRMILEEYQPESLQVIEKYMGGMLSENEKKILEIFRQNATVVNPNPDDDDNKLRITLCARDLR